MGIATLRALLGALLTGARCLWTFYHWGTHELRCLLAASVIAVLAACGGDAEEVDPNRGVGWVSINSPTDASTYSTQASSLQLSGFSFVSPDKSVCCYPADAGVTVTWSSSTGASGGASQSAIVSGGFGQPFIYNNKWSALIPLTVGTNVIRVEATDGPNSGTDTITVTRTPDQSPPRVLSVSPTNGAPNVAVNLSSISATFSESMDNATITPVTFTLRDNMGNLVPGTVTVADFIGTFRPAALLTGFTVYSATLSTDIRDAAGNTLPMAYTWTFATGNADMASPTIASVSSPAGSSCTALDAELVVVFSEPVDPSTVTNLGIRPSFTLTDTTDGRSRVSDHIRTEGNSAVLDPDFLLGYSRSYTAVLTSRITDLAGNSLPPTEWTFSIQSSGSGVGTWQPTSTTGAPQGVEKHSAVWTGTEMITFGGAGAVGQVTDVGGRYTPASDAWTLLPPSGPSPRQGHVAVWTGTEMIVWGGTGAAGPLGDGSRYNPATNTWTPISAVAAPSARSDATAVWTGSEMIVWGGKGSSELASDHATYNPTTDTWRPISNVGTPTHRVRHTAVWTGNRMIVWGGDTDCASGSCSTATGAVYDPIADSWQQVGSSGAPSNRTAHSAVWTGSEMAVWGGRSGNDIPAPGLSTGALYEPSTDTWREIPTVCGAAGRYGHSAVWTGNEMIVWGGYSTRVSGGGLVSSASRGTGARYSPGSDSWQHLTGTNAPLSDRRNQSIVWTGSQMIVWGGFVSDLGTGGLYTP